MRVRFHGAAGEVTGSCHEVHANGKMLLLDCGMIQGSEEDEKRNELEFPFEISSIDAVVLSHAHIDHCGRLPLLVSRGYRGPIYTQAATADLLKILLEDAASLAMMDAERDNKHRRDGHQNHRPLFTKVDVGNVLKHVKVIAYDETTEIFPGVAVTLRDAGHILGSASVSVEADGKTLLFSGDLGPVGTPILRDPAIHRKADLVLLESTYGGRLHRSREATVSELGEIFEQAWNDGGNVLIPAFAVGRSQELLYWFAKYFDEWNLKRWKIFLDSPMAVKVVDVVDRHVDLFDEDAKKVWQGKIKPFNLPNLHFTPEVSQSQEINNVKHGAIIIAGSGMCTGGRIRHHLRNHLGNKKHHIIFVGYQANGTLGRRLVDGVATVRIFNEEFSVNAQRHTIGGLSAHADQAGLMEWYGHLEKNPPVVLVHGEDDARVAMKEAMEKKFDCDVSLARPDRELEL
ncbi:MAG TPA: MBL fold metallo-hydrolase [Arenimonas sp.]|nr:MBL fold metallo-hydrolase [Arenimonas sp.]